MPPLCTRVTDLTVTELVKEPSILLATSRLAQVYDFANHQYFVWARHPDTSLSEYRESQSIYWNFVEHFSRALTAVLARIGPMVTRQKTVYSNVAEEHGYGEHDRSHWATSLSYLRAIGVDERLIARECPARLFVTHESLIAYCLVQPAEIGAAALAVIEYTHIKIATMLAHNMFDRFWGDLGAQQHYRFHAEIDSEHALGLFAVSEEGWKTESQRRRIAEGMLFGAQVWWSVFEALLPRNIIPPSKQDSILPLFGPDALAHREQVVDRPYPRHLCALPVTLSYGGAESAATVVGINRFGCQLVTPLTLPLDSEVTVLIPAIDSVAASAAPLTLHGRVRSRPETHDGSGLCIEFPALPAATHEQLSTLCSALRTAS